jgi:hypothetical protein
MLEVKAAERRRRISPAAASVLRRVEKQKPRDGGAFSRPD